MSLIHLCRLSTLITSLLCESCVWWFNAILVIFIVSSVQGKIDTVQIYKKRMLYGFLNFEHFFSIESFIAQLSRDGFTIGKTKQVRLINRLFPNK